MKTYASLPLALTTKEVVNTLKSRRLFLRALSAGWIKPHVQGDRGRTSIFKGEDVQTLWIRLGKEQPPLLPYERKSISAYSFPELMGCIAIIAILAGVLIPAVCLNRCASAEITAKQELQTLNGAYQNYVAAGGVVLATNAPVEAVYSAVKGKVGDVGPFLIREGNLPTFETCTGPKEVVWTVNGFTTPAPTPVVTATPVATATATPSATPTASPTPSPTPTPNPTPTATPTPTPSNYTVALALTYRGIALPDVVTANVVLTNQTTSPTSAAVSFTASTGLATLGTSEATAVVSGSGFTWSGNLTASGTKTIKVYLWPSNAGRFFMAASNSSGQTATDEGEAWDPQAVAYAVFQTANGARSLGYLNGWSVAGASANGNYGGGYSWKDGTAGAIQQMLAGATWPQNPTPGFTSVTLVAPAELTSFPSSANAMPQPASYKSGLASYLYTSVNSGGNPSTPPDNLKFRPGDWSWPGWGVAVPGRTIKQSVATGWSANYVTNGTLPYGVQNYRQVRSGYASPYQ